jgi:uncharacterized DUF497 family protein
MEFEWDDKKAESNYQKHAVRFSEAVTVWLDENALEIPDPEHSNHEERWIRLGFSSRARILLIIFVEKHEEIIRIISARKAKGKEQLQYVNRSKR